MHLQRNNLKPQPRDDSMSSNASESSQSSQQSNPRPKPKRNRIIVNVADTQYTIIKDVCREMGWRLQYDKEGQNWDLLWTDNSVETDILGKMQQHQKINHFPGMYSLSRKNYLARGLCRLRKIFGDDYNFFPDTWLIPAEMAELRNNMESAAKGKIRTYIAKPQASCQGRGIFLTRSIQNFDIHQHYVVQRYLCRPYLIDNLKFDLRIYVLVAGCNPLRIYKYKEGLARFATVPYETPRADNLDELCMHLTNYAINKESEDFVSDECDFSKGHKRSLSSVYDQLEEEGVDMKNLHRRIHDIIIKTLIVGQPIISHHYKACQSMNLANNMCFEILGFDIVLDHEANPFLLEINHSPSFNVDTQLDVVVKQGLIRDTLHLMNISVTAKKQIIKMRRKEIQDRMMTGRKMKLSQEDKKQQAEKLLKSRFEYEAKNLGDFQLLYPHNESQVEEYAKYFQSSALCYTQSTDIKRTSKIPQPDLAPIIPPHKNNILDQPQLTKSKHHLTAIPTSPSALHHLPSQPSAVKKIDPNKSKSMNLFNNKKTKILEQTVLICKPSLVYKEEIDEVQPQNCRKRRRELVTEHLDNKEVKKLKSGCFLNPQQYTIKGNYIQPKTFNPSFTPIHHRPTASQVKNPPGGKGTILLF